MANVRTAYLAFAEEGLGEESQDEEEMDDTVPLLQTARTFAKKICRMPCGISYDEAGQDDDEDDESSEEEGYNDEEEEPEKCSWFRASLHQEESKPMTLEKKISLACVSVFALWLGLHQTDNLDDASVFVKNTWDDSTAPQLALIIAAPPALVLLASYNSYKPWKSWTEILVLAVGKLQWALIVLLVLVPLVVDFKFDFSALSIFAEHGQYQYLTINLLAIAGAVVWAGITMFRDGLSPVYACLTTCFVFPIFIVLYVIFIVATESDKEKCQLAWVQSAMPVAVMILVQAESSLESLMSGAIQLHARIHDPPNDPSEVNVLTVSVIVSIICMATSIAMIDKKGHVSRWLCIKSKDGSELSSSPEEEALAKEYIPMVVGVAPYESVPFILVFAYRLASVESRLLFFVLVQQATQEYVRLFGIAVAGPMLLLGDALLQGLLIWQATGTLAGLKIFYAFANTASVVEPLLHGGPAIFTAEIKHTAAVHMFEEVIVLLMLVVVKGFDNLLDDFSGRMLPFVWLCIAGLVSKYPLLIIIRNFCAYRVEKQADTGLALCTEAQIEAAGADNLDRQVPAYLIVFGLTLDKGSSIVLSSNIRYIGAIGCKALGGMLATNEVIQELDMKGTKCGDNGAVAMANGLKKNKYKSLNKLNLSSNDIGVKKNSGCEALGRMLATNEAPGLELIMSFNNCGDKGVVAIANGLEANKFLIKLELQKNNIGVKGFEAVGRMLATNKAIKFLGMCENSGGDNGAKAIADGLKDNKSLKNLDLGKNDIGPIGFKALGVMLADDGVIEVLSMWGNNCGAEGATYLAYCLPRNKSLKKLTLNGNKITTSGFQALGEMLEANKDIKIEELIVPGNTECGELGAAALARGLKVNKSLKNLVLKGTPIDTSDKEALQRAVKERPPDANPCKLVL